MKLDFTIGERDIAVTISPTVIWFLVGILVVALVGIYWHGGLQQALFVNTNRKGVDQQAYMDYAEDLRRSGYTYIGDRNRMPLYPLFQSLFYRESMTEPTYFLIGKINNLALSVVVLGAVFLITRLKLGWLASASLTLVTAFEVFIFKAGWFQAEILFYFFNFCLFLLLWNLIEEPSWWGGLLTGFVGALAHLTKASILPGFLLGLLVVALRASVKGFARWRNRSDPDRVPITEELRPIAISVLAGLVFLSVLSPYLLTSKRVFGRYFYNVNSTFYFWYDSWEEAEAGTKAHGDRVGWPDMPEEEIPGPAKYFREHTTEQILTRITEGGQNVLRILRGSYGFHRFAAVFAAVAGLGLGLRALQQRSLRVWDPWHAFFLVAYFAGYFVLFGWYSYILLGPRLVLGLFLPFMFTMALALSRGLGDLSWKALGKSWTLEGAFHWGILLWLGYDVWHFILPRVGVFIGGR